MSATDIVTIGEPMPRLESVAPAGPLSVTAGWAEGSRAGLVETVDLAPVVLVLRHFAPLRSNEQLFSTVHLVDDGRALAWGADEAIDMAATTLERLAEETMTNADFSAWLKRCGYTLDTASAALGISRRLVAYYAKDRPVPRYIALACTQLESDRHTKPREQVPA